MENNLDLLMLFELFIIIFVVLGTVVIPLYYICKEKYRIKKEAKEDKEVFTDFDYSNLIKDTEDTNINKNLKTELVPQIEGIDCNNTINNCCDGKICYSPHSLKNKINQKIFEIKSKIRNLNTSFKYFIIKLSLAIIRKIEKNNNYASHAIQEFNITYGKWREDKMQNLICNQILDLLNVLSTQGDSGSSISYKKNLFNKLMMFEPISKLKLDDNEFKFCYMDDERNYAQNRIKKNNYFSKFIDDNNKLADLCVLVNQNNRNSSYFKDVLYNKKTKKSIAEIITYNEAIAFQSLYYIGEDLQLKLNKYKSTYTSGHMCIIRPDGSIYVANNWYLKNPAEFNSLNYKKVIIPRYEIEMPKGWWISFIKEDDLKNAEDFYKNFDLNINSEEDSKAYLKEEIINFKNSKYAQKYMDAINIIIADMYPELKNKKIIDEKFFEDPRESII